MERVQHDYDGVRAWALVFFFEEWLKSTGVDTADLRRKATAPVPRRRPVTRARTLRRVRLRLKGAGK